jgi:hypothetical protein
VIALGRFHGDRLVHGEPPKRKDNGNGKTGGSVARFGTANRQSRLTA